MSEQIPDGPREALSEGISRAERNVAYHQRELLKLIEAEKRSHEAVEREKASLNAEIQKCVEIEVAIRRLSK